MTSTLHIALDNCPDYILKEAEILISRLGELASDSDKVLLRLSRSNLLYQADIRVDYFGEHLSSLVESRYLNEALEDSFTKVSGLLRSLNGQQRTESIM